MSLSTQKNKADPSSDQHSASSHQSCWLDIAGTVAIPLAITVLTAAQIWIAQLNRAQDLAISIQNRAQDLKIANETLQHGIMSRYLEEMEILIFDKGLLKANNPEVKSVAKAVTLNTARQLDPERKGQLLKFLYESNLVGHCELNAQGKSDIKTCTEPIVSLYGVKLSELQFEPPPIPLARIDLEGADLTHAALPGIVLIDAEMNSATLNNATLSESVLTDAKMYGAKLQNANLSNALLIRTTLIAADLNGANLQGSKLIDADLRCAELRSADLREADLTNTKLQNAKYSADTQLPPGFEPVTHGLIQVARDGNTPPYCVLE
ncbi:MAG: pentapeptide repeat-containing protein [Elainella sp. Prado103]|jgi:uncharacterized protein YjbI with pentapeptide repeats|nr:pentapeptide repeat-containing protein [Elainella sp. Prado103]